MVPVYCHTTTAHGMSGLRDLVDSGLAWAMRLCTGGSELLVLRRGSSWVEAKVGMPAKQYEMT